MRCETRRYESHWRRVRSAVDGAKLASNQTTYKRDLAGYISERDLQQLYMKSIETPDIRDERGVSIIMIIIGIHHQFP